MAMKATEAQIEQAGSLMADRFAADPGIKAQTEGLKRGADIVKLQCCGQVRAFASAGFLTLLDGGPSFLIGYRSDALPPEYLVEVLQDASRELLGALSADELMQLQEKVAPVAAISDEFWYARHFPNRAVYVLQVVAVASELKGTGAFRRLVSPVIAECDASGIPMVLQTHNPDNVPLYEHFGFKLVEKVDSQELELSCYNMARMPAEG